MTRTGDPERESHGTANGKMTPATSPITCPRVDGQAHGAEMQSAMRRTLNQAPIELRTFAVGLTRAGNDGDADRYRSDDNAPQLGSTVDRGINFKMRHLMRVRGIRLPR
jgi:hypothetical protein